MKLATRIRTPVIHGPIPRESVAATSPDIKAEQIEQLKNLFPQVVSEGKIDFEKLREMLGDAVESRPERYSFTWAGKRDAIRALADAERCHARPGA